MTWTPAKQLNYYEQSPLSLSDFVKPRARATDPVAAHLAAAEVAPGNEQMIKAIRRAVWAYGPLTAWQVAEEVGKRFPGRWKESSIRTACAPRRSGLRQFSARIVRSGETREKLTTLYALPAETVDTQGRT